VHLLRGLKPEFGYFFPSPSLRHKIGLALAFTVFGLVACASSLALLVADEPDPQRAFALAPLQSPSRGPATLAATAEMPAVEAVPARKAARADGIKPCQRNAGNDGDAKCDSGATRKPGVVPAVTDPPATSELPIGHGNGPAAGASASAVLVASPPPLTATAPEAADVAPPASVAEAPAPEGSATKQRNPARRHGSRRYSDNSYRRSGYARPHFFPFFW
jgi:hypothetical protein